MINIEWNNKPLFFFHRFNQINVFLPWRFQTHHLRVQTSVTETTMRFGNNFHKEVLWYKQSNVPTWLAFWTYQWLNWSTKLNITIYFLCCFLWCLCLNLVCVSWFLHTIMRQKKNNYQTHQTKPCSHATAMLLPSPISLTIERKNQSREWNKLCEVKFHNWLFT